MHVTKTLAEYIGRQHEEAVVGCIRKLANALQWEPLMGRLHDYIETFTSGLGSVSLQTVIAIKRPYRTKEVAEPWVFTVVTQMDGNVWRTKAEPVFEKGTKPTTTNTSSGGSALYGSPQDATGIEICQLPPTRKEVPPVEEQLPLPFPEGTRLGWPSLVTNCLPRPPRDHSATFVRYAKRKTHG